MQIVSALRQRWIPAIFVIAFLVIIAVNATLIVAASKTFSGLVVANPYQKGAEYSASLRDLSEQHRLNWQHRITVAPTGADSISLHVQWSDAAGLALSGLTVTATLERPVEKIEPVSLLLQDRGGGVYGASVRLPRAGIWDLRVRAEGNGHHMVAADRIRVAE
ncbi:MAG: FixH family protein [Ferrovibrio sp.]